MLGIIKDVNNVIFDGIDAMNPMVSKMDDKNQEIATALLDTGYTKKEIQNFVDVSRTQFDDWIDFEIEIRARMSKANKPKEV